MSKIDKISRLAIQNQISTISMHIPSLVLVKTVGVSLKASEDVLMSNNCMKIWCTVTLKEYQNLVYCNLAAILQIFFQFNRIQIRA